jgi:hypothetical protein
MKSPIIMPGAQPQPVALAIMGLDLRDHLAALSLSAAAVRVGDIELAVDSEWCAGVAEVAYELADAMIKARAHDGAS